MTSLCDTASPSDDEPGRTSPGFVFLRGFA
jgi:hypothetical protein